MKDILTSFGVEWHVLLVSIVNFAVLAVALWFVMIKPLVALLEQREQTIKSSLERAELERQEAKVLEGKLADERKTAAEQARTMIAEAEAKAAAIVKHAATEAEAKAAAIVDDAQKKAASERDQLIADATSQLGELVVDATRLVVGRTITPTLDQTVVREAISSARSAAK